MWPYLVSGLVGALLVHRQVPKTKVKKLECIGPNTGNHYKVEDFRGTTMIVVMAGPTRVTLQQNPGRPGFHFIAARQGSEREMVHAILFDFSGVQQQPLQEEGSDGR